jgi:hypothetical protein
VAANVLVACGVGEIYPVVKLHAGGLKDQTVVGCGVEVLVYSYTRTLATAMS